MVEVVEDLFAFFAAAAASPDDLSPLFAEFQQLKCNAMEWHGTSAASDESAGHLSSSSTAAL